MRLHITERREIRNDSYGWSDSKVKEIRSKIDLRHALISMQDWYNHILKGVPYSYSYISTSTRLDNNWVFKKQWALFVDCDSDENLILAVDYLTKVRNTKFNIVQSSPDHYWIITDIVGSFNTIWSELALVPGVDEKYVNHAAWGKDFYVRAFPNNFATFKIPDKNAAAATTDAIIPKFPEKSELTNPSVQKWYNQLKKYYEHDLVPIIILK